MLLPRWLEPDVRKWDTILFCNTEWGVGQFRLPAAHPDFKSSGPYSACYFAFPRTSVLITDASGRTFTSTPSQINCYGVGARLQRDAIESFDDNTDYYVISESLLRSHAAGEQAQALLLNKQFHCPPDIYIRQRQLVENLRAHRLSTPLEKEAEVLSFVSDLIERLLQFTESRNARPQRMGTDRQRDRIEYVKKLACGVDHDATSLRTLAEKANMSPWHLSREFKRYVGEPLHQFVIKNRLYQSLDRIADRGISISDIAHDLGFSHHSHFTMSFTRLFGCTPRSFRGT